MGIERYFETANSMALEPHEPIRNPSGTRATWARLRIIDEGIQPEHQQPIGNFHYPIPAIATPTLQSRVESVWQVMPPMEDASMSYLMKWQSAKREWISTLTLQATGPLQASYWQKLSDQVEAAYDFRQATVRAQADSTGKVSMLLEQRIAPMFTFSVAGELDHAKSSHP
ncbi:translocase of outer mitochondrial membrane [Puccinia graminis f. sp. tritici]|uniref:Translocase of outer mitochondrial membrane n=1 Tax=Puccinia graminis f. sp. tritici TaxID=56615 RepID=A0A5B0R4T8_PUCGR|nr:translocase of outer mitochondrial membrane [Puccinia graminis f. sp. tritici]